MLCEKKRLKEKDEDRKKWHKWGPYLTERQWGTVREDYSPDGEAWGHITHDMARSKAYRWGEEGIAGISDDKQRLCFGLAFWNYKDPIIKERIYGLTGNEGNHGEDVKEYYYYLDNTPTHSYMKMLYKYPQQEFPYNQLITENQKRGKTEDEFELIDTGVFDENRYFDIFIEYAKEDIEDILIKVSVHNRGKERADLQVLPTTWFRNTWAWKDKEVEKPTMTSINNKEIVINHKSLGTYHLYAQRKGETLFCDNESNLKKLYGDECKNKYFKDGINEFIINGDQGAINYDKKGTKAAFQNFLSVEGESVETCIFRLSKKALEAPFKDAEAIFDRRKGETDEFYGGIQKEMTSEDEKLVQRQAFAGMLWTKQFYYLDIPQWLNGDSGQEAPPESRKKIRNDEWMHLNNADIISMPDKWEYPWYAAWDLAFHCIPLSILDPKFAKDQLVLMTREWYMHPNGQLPAYEWNFGDVNPPVHAWATWKVYCLDKKQNNGNGDIKFLQSILHKLLLNFTWWVNRKDIEGKNIFQGGFLGLDNIGVFDRSDVLPTGGHLEQSDGTSWMAMYSLNLMRLSLEIAKTDCVYEEIASKFFEHFMYIAGAMNNVGGQDISMWDEEDEFFYDVLHNNEDDYIRLKIRSMVGLIPLFAVETLCHDCMDYHTPDFKERLDWFLKNRPELAKLVSKWAEPGNQNTHLLSILHGERLKKILKPMLDPTEFLSDYGIRAISRYHLENPYTFNTCCKEFKVTYTPGESDSGLFGGNSNWRGPIWFPLNYLLIESLFQFHKYYGDSFKVEYPTGSGSYSTLKEVGLGLIKRLSSIFKEDSQGNRPVFSQYPHIQKDPHFNKYILFFEYFHGDTGRGVGANHQTGWTGVIAEMLLNNGEIE